MRAAFVSDSHIESRKDPKYSLLVDWLRSLKGQNFTHIFFVGDLFDLWIGNRDFFKKEYAELINEVQALVKLGLEIHYFEGNHDLYLKDFWGKELGLFVHEGPEHFQLGSWTVRVEHGDEINQNDFSYLILRWFLRTPPLKYLAKNLPEKILLNLGMGASHKSRRYTSSESKRISRERSLQILRAHALREFKNKTFDWLISGHIHEKDEFTFLDPKSKHRVIHSINLGSWLETPKVFILDSLGGHFSDLD